MKIFMASVVLLGGAMGGAPALAKTKKVPFAAYRPTVREMLLEDVQIERFSLQDPDEKKWLNLESQSFAHARVEKKKDVNVFSFTSRSDIFSN